MRFLDRSIVPPPACLSTYRLPQDWGAVTFADKTAIVGQLNRLQGQRCAYCECDLENEGRYPHIEHFVQRSREPSQTFVWANLFRSCSHEDRCGKHKDKQEIVASYVQGVLVKPDVDDPRAFLRFRGDGEVEVRHDAPSAQRAAETIRVFHLNHVALKAMRKPWMDAARQEAEKIAEFGLDEETEALFQLLVEDWRGKPHEAAIFDVLGA